jgi:hypothetical protein
MANYQPEGNLMTTSNHFPCGARVALLVLGLLAGLASAALAAYDDRQSEVLAELDKAEVSTEERGELKTMLDKFFAAREDCLEALVDIIKKKDENEQDAIFAARAGMCASGGSQILGEALKGIKDPSLAALHFVNIFAADESTFFQGLLIVTVAEARDLIVRIGDRLAEMADVLEEKWDAILDEDETLDERAKRMSAEIRTDLDDAIKRAADANQDMAELIAEGVKKWSEDEMLPTPTTGNAVIDTIISGVKSLASPTISMWQATNTRSVSRVGAFKTLFDSERRVMVMFKQVRADVQKFLDENDFPRAEAAYTGAKSSLDGFAGSTKTSGQKSDAEELRNHLMQELADRLKDAATIYGDFVKDHKEKFFGAVGADIRKELLEPDAWREYASHVQGFDLDDKLRTWEGEATNYFEVDLSPLSSEARENLKTLLRAIIDDLIKELKEAGKTYKDVVVVVEDERESVDKELD